VNQTLARRYWPGASPLGARIRMSSTVDTIWRTVVGVVGDVRSAGLEQEPRPEYFLPYQQFPRHQGMPAATASLVVRGRMTAAELASLVGGVVRELSPDVAVTEPRSMDQVLESARSGRRLQFLLLSGFAVAALGLLALGVYGVVAHVVSLRTREFGIRLALGARRRTIEALVVRNQLGLIGAGIGLGLAGGLLVGRAMRSLLFGVRANDPLVFLAAVGAVAIIALAASLGPAVRAGRAQIVDVLRSD
jgi:hypothetical protein